MSDRYDHEKTDQEMLARYGFGQPAAPPEPTPEELVKTLGAEPIPNGPERLNHLAWCKQHALSCVPDIGQVISSLMQDLADDPRTADSVGVVQHLMFPLVLIGDFTTAAEQRKMILDFG